MSSTSSPAETASRRRWLALGLIAAAQFMSSMDTSFMRSALPQSADRPGSRRGYQLGLLTPTSSRARIASSSVSAARPLRRPPDLRSRLGGMAVVRWRQVPSPRGSSRAGGAGCRLSSDQRRRVTLLFTIFGYTPKGATKALALSARRGRRRHSRCVPRRRPQRVRQLAVALLHQPALAAVS